MCEFFNFMIISFWFRCRFTLFGIAPNRSSSKSSSSIRRIRFGHAIDRIDESKCESKYLWVALLPIYVWIVDSFVRQSAFAVHPIVIKLECAGFFSSSLSSLRSSCLLYLFTSPKSQHTPRCQFQLSSVAVDRRLLFATFICHNINTTRKMNENTHVLMAIKRYFPDGVWIERNRYLQVKSHRRWQNCTRGVLGAKASLRMQLHIL